MKTPRFRLFLRTLPPAVLAGSLLVAYMSTLAPGLSWANGGSDGGDLIAAAASGGVAHPTGYPLYLLLARLFQFLPFGSLAFRTNLMSAIFAVLGAVLVYEIVTRSRFTYLLEPAWPGGMVAAYAFGLAPLVWSQAVITEVYTLQAFLTALILYLYTLPEPDSASRQKRLDRWRGLALGLGTCNQVTTILILPAALVLGSFHDQSEPDLSLEPSRAGFHNARFDVGSLRRQLVFLGTGLTLYLIIPLRASANPPVNWGNPVTLERFWWLVSGQLYQSYYLQFSLLDIWDRMQAGASLLLHQFGLVGLTLSLVGLVVFGARSRLYVLTVWMAVVHAVFAAFYSSIDSYVYLIPMLLCFAVWAGQGFNGLTQQPNQHRYFFRAGLALLILSALLAQSVRSASEVDASRDLRAESFGRQVLSTAPQGAIVFAKGDRSVFALWYFGFALGERPDLMIIATDLLHFDWYQETLRTLYPSLRISGPFPWPETITLDNPSLPVCYVEYQDEAMIDCSFP